MDYIKRPEPTVRREPGYTSELMEWVQSDCPVVECIEGNVFVEENGYTKLYNCPRCSRTGVTPGRRVWNGAVTLRSDEEMARRQVDRKELVFNRKGRYEQATELVRMLADICKPAEEVVRKRQEMPDLPPGNMTSEELAVAAKNFRTQGGEHVGKNQR